MNTTDMFSEKDLDQIQEQGLSPEYVQSQLKRFKKGFPSIELSAPATVEKGIKKLFQEEMDFYIKKYEKAKIDVLKFVPASGAATRMFKNLFSFLEKFDGNQKTLNNILRENKKAGKFFTELDEFAFYKELNETLLIKKGISVADALKTNKHNLILNVLLMESGLNYGNLPKGLLSFHEYEDHVRTAAQEHLAEGLDYTAKDGKVRIHFTISPSHKKAFNNHISRSIKELASNTEISVSFSEQLSGTDTIAAKSDFDLFRNEEGNLLFRPAGHGALLENLNNQFADLIYIKNIDNVVPDRLRSEGIKYKKALAGILLYYQEQIFNLLKSKEQGHLIVEEGIDLLGELGIIGNFSESDVAFLLDRPIRVCGMVKNEGEPGGGPFWVKHKERVSLQIVESAQVNKADEHQVSIFRNGIYFNPVDIVCGVKNHRGEKYDLLEYRDEEAGFISEKTYNGQKLLAMELPGLWNGGMANWNTIFVEVPLVTFNPVKTVTDLLKPAHR
ncbi:DUF4301 family protein [Ekhidna sp.]|uniref:DUF4301 family protein n=1 Tax=Ekhidna sp. TaxID=2608089 RepID=UPI003297AECD